MKPFLLVFTLILSHSLFAKELTKKQNEYFVNIKEAVAYVAISPKGDFIVSSNKNSLLCLWSVKDGKFIKSFHGHKKDINQLVISENGNYIVSCYKDGIVRLLDVKKGTFREIFKNYHSISSYCKNLLISKNEKYIVWSSKNGDVKLWDTKKDKVIKGFKGYKKFNLLSFKINDKYIALGGYFDEGGCGVSDGDCFNFKEKVMIWNIEKKKMAHILEWKGIGFEDAYLFIDITEDYIIATTSFNEIRLWDIESGKLLKTFRNYKEQINAIEICYNQGKEYILAGLKNAGVLIWDIKSGELTKDFFNKKNQSIHNMTISPNGKYIAISGFPDFVSVGDKITKKVLYSIAFNSEISSIVISHDNKYLIIAINSSLNPIDFRIPTDIKVIDLESGIKLITQH